MAGSQQPAFSNTQVLGLIACHTTTVSHFPFLKYRPWLRSRGWLRLVILRFLTPKCWDSGEMLAHTVKKVNFKKSSSPPFKLLSQECSGDPQKNTSYCHWFLLSKRTWSKTLFLKVPNILATGRREIKLVLTWKLLPCSLGSEKWSAGCWGRKDQQSCLAVKATNTGMTGLKRWACWCNSQMNATRLTNWFLQI